MTVKKRGLVRIISFTAAVILTLGARNIQLMASGRQASVALENNYLRAVEDLSAAADNITNTLSKGIYSATPQMLEKLSTKLWSEASNAKIALSQLPMEIVQLENTYKFLSQVGNYALAISQKLENGEELSEEEYRNLKILYDYSRDFSQNMWELESLTSSGEITLAEAGAYDTKEPPEITDGFTKFEESFENYPTLIYDGPFSDHIMEKEPEMLKNQSEVSAASAKMTAAKYANVNESSLEESDPEAGKMPSYVFDGDGVTVAVTKQGGFVSYMLKSREVISNSISKNTALNNAVDYLLDMQIDNMKVTYYECYNNVMVINFASKQDEVLCYTDLIKVSVALDNGEILGFDARGYLVNHRPRNFGEIKITEKQAKNTVSPLLTPKSVQLALIPTDGLGEALCYEVLCESSEGNKVLVYINVKTGGEEQILILYESENGVLAM